MRTAAANQAELVEGILLEIGAEKIVLGLPGTDYRLHLVLAGPLAVGTSAGLETWVRGVIRARVKRVDKTGTGGRYIEPVYGRPRRIQGMVRAIDPAGNGLTIQCTSGCAMVCQLTMGQKAGDFSINTLVTTEVERGATFEPMNP